MKKMRLCALEGVNVGADVANVCGVDVGEDVGVDEDTDMPEGDSGELLCCLK